LNSGDSGNNILCITSPGQGRPVLSIRKLHTLILEIFKQAGDTVTFYREIKFLRVGHLTATQPHFSLIGFKNISFATYFDKHSCSFSFAITIEEEPVNTKCQYQEKDE
jgi:hypothetical protein